MAVIVGGLLAVAPAVAQANYVPSGSFGSGQLRSPIGVAVDPSSHDVYVGNLLFVNNDKYDSSGNLISPPSPFGSGGLYSGAAVNPTNGDVYIVNGGNTSVDTFDPSTGALISSFQVPGSGNFFGAYTVVQIVTDAAGNVYVPNAPNNAVQEYSPAGTLLNTFAGSGAAALSAPTGVAVDASGNVWVADTGNNRIEEFDPTGTTVLNTIASTGVQSVALDSAGDVFAYVLNGTDSCGSLSSPCNHVVKYSPAGAQVDDFGAGTIGESYYQQNYGAVPTLAVDQATGAVYVADGANNVVWVFRPQKPPGVDSTYSTQVTADAGTLGAAINPNGLDTTYHFEYGTTSSYGQSTPESASIGSDFGDHTASAILQGLSASTTYHYRVVAANSLGTSDGPDHTFTTQASGSAFALADNRAYEMVSPVNKNGSDAISEGLTGWTTLAAVSGGSVTYTTIGNGFAGASSSCFVTQYLSRRTSGGWTTEGISPPIASEMATGAGPCIGNAYPNEYFTPDLSAGVVQHADPPLTSDAPAGEVNLYLAGLADAANPSYQAVTTSVPPGNPPFTFDSSDFPRATVPSTDLSHVVFVQNDALTPNAPGGGVPNVYEWTGGQLRLVNIAPGGSVLAGGATTGFDLPGTGGTPSDQTHTVSADGSRIFFSSPSTGTPGSNRETNIYVGETGTTTVEVSASQRGTPDPAGPQPMRFWRANADGSKVLFTTCEKLTDDATAVAPSGVADCNNQGSVGGLMGQDLYQYDLGTGQLTDLTVDHTAGDALGADVQGVTASSDDGSYIYFVANGSLAPGATSGKPNLYRYHAGTTTFIATLVPGTGGSGDSSAWADQLAFNTARVTPDGTHLAFQSIGRPTGYDNTDANTGQPDAEVYLYDTVSNRLICVSCNPTGARPTGPSTLGAQGEQNQQPRNLSDDGSRLFFESADALVSAASNGATNVYEYENGHVYLLDPGNGTSLFPEGNTNAEAAFLDASPSGSDVFIATRDQLWPDDTDNLMDVYDVRVCTSGSPCIAPPPPPSSSTCLGDGCRAGLSGTAAPPTAATVSFTGPGNVHGSSTGSVRVLSRTVHGAVFFVRVSVPGAGRITIAGAGIGTVTKSVGHAGTYSLKVALTPKARRTLARKRKLKLKLNVGYAPADGASSATVTFTIQATTRRHAKRHARRARTASHNLGGAR